MVAVPSTSTGVTVMVAVLVPSSTRAADWASMEATGARLFLMDRAPLVVVDPVRVSLSAVMPLSSTRLKVPPIPAAVVVWV